VVVAASLAVGMLTGGALAQNRASAAAAQAGAAGDKALEDKLMGALASREMDSLLDYYFKKHNVPPDRQATIRSIAAWRELNNPSLPPARRRALLMDGIKGIGAFVQSTRDTELLMTRAGQLIEFGMKGQINQIEYFGEAPKAQGELNEAAEAVMKLLDRTIEECESQENQVLAGQTKPNAGLMAKWQALDDRMNTAKWTKAFASYGLALSLDAANPRRKEIADAALTFLKEFEDPQYQREAAVKLQEGKLNTAKGDTTAAVTKFQEALKAPNVDKVAQYEALYGIALANLLAKKADPAAAALGELQQWVTANLQGDDAKSVSASVGLLEYRINDLRATLAKSPQEKQKFTEAGDAALSKVMTENPRLAPTIKRMMLDRLPADADLTKQDTVLLQSLMARGVDEVIRAKDALADDKGKPVIQRALQAVAELQKRKGVADDVIDEASFLEPIFWAKLGDNARSVEESLDYIAHGKNRDRIRDTLTNALIAVDALRKSPDSGSQRISDLITRTWKLAIDAGRKEYTFVYGKRLADRAKTPADYKAAAAALHAVPENHPAVLHARFYELSALQEVPDDKSLVPAARVGVVGDIQRLAADVNRRIDAALATAKEDQKPRLKFYKVSATLLAADLLQKEQKDNAGVLKMLQGFEETAKGLPQEDKLDATALRLRVNAYMALGKTQDAVDEVKKLVASQQGGNATVLFNMIGQMDDAYGKAKAAGDREAMRQNSAAQVALITPLIDQTKDEAVRNKYKQWKADLVLRAARNEDDAKRRSQYLTEAQQTFTELMKLAKEGSPQFDTMRYKLALVSYELKDYKKVQQELGQLIANRRLGDPDLRESSPDGNDTFRENPVYWEGLLRYMQANWELAKTDKSPQMTEAINNARDTLKTLYINRGKNVGGERLRDEYAKLKEEMLPGWDENQVAPAGATSRPAQAASATK
jgi:hypothetical protein